MGGVILLLLMIAALYYDDKVSDAVRAIYVTGFILACIIYYRADTIMDRLKEIEIAVTPDDERSEDEKAHQWYKRARKQGLMGKS